jgi:hypothetical protein
MSPRSLQLVRMCSQPLPPTIMKPLIEFRQCMLCANRFYALAAAAAAQQISTNKLNCEQKSRIFANYRKFNLFHSHHTHTHTHNINVHDCVCVCVCAIKADNTKFIKTVCDSAGREKNCKWREGERGRGRF